MNREVKKMAGVTIEEAIEYFNEKAHQCQRDGFMSLARYWGGYHDALVDIKDGTFRLEQESKR